MSVVKEAKKMKIKFFSKQNLGQILEFLLLNIYIYIYIQDISNVLVLYLI